MAGILYGIGVGPGEPELITFKAARIMRECDMIGIPAKDAVSCTAYKIAVQAVPEIECKPVLSVPIPMTTDKRKLEKAYAEGCECLKEQLEKGKNVAFLNLGDPTIYSTYMGVHERMQKKGYDARLVSGVPSFCAVAAALNLALGTGKENIHILPGCYHPEELTDYDGTRILMKSGSKVGEVKRKLLEMEASGEIKACAVTNCGMEDQAVCQDIGKLSKEAGYFTTIIVKDNK